MSKRKLENWLETYKRWVYPRSEAPLTFILWSGISTIASVIRRKVYIGKRLLGGWECFPFQYIFFIGPPGSRKTTAMYDSDDLLEHVPNITMIPQAMTEPDFKNKLSGLKEASATIHSLEFGTFYNQSKSQMIDTLTALYDGRKKFDSSTLSRGLELATKPCVNILAATTPQWIADNLTEGMVGGGFFTRVMPIYEFGPRRREMWYEGLDQDALNKLKEQLIEDLVHISANIEGEFKITEEGKLFFGAWYKKNADRYARESDSRLMGYYERKPAHALKVAQALHLSYSDDLEITEDDLKNSLYLVRQVEVKMLKVYQSVGKNPYTSVMEALEEFIGMKVNVTKKELLTRFYHAAPMDKLLELINALQIIGKISCNGSDPANITYHLSETKKEHME